jgi:bis(5'-nucleosyl)-tetraphosphatase (symmetrical)
MSTYVIGDIQGCHTEFCRLLELIAFSTSEDTLWCAGDLVNRGPASAMVLRECIALGPSVHAVLGNHDIHCLVRAANIFPPKKYDSLMDVMQASDRDELVNWLRLHPFAAKLQIGKRPYLIVHAGCVPGWTADDALSYSREAEKVLHSKNEKTVTRFLSELYGNKPARFSKKLKGMDRLRAIVNVFTRLRFCAPDGTLDFKETGNLTKAPAGMKAWFGYSHRETQNVTMVCGHWSTLGALLMPNVLMLDSGCLWGGMLTAVRLEDQAVFQVASVA